MITGSQQKYPRLKCYLETKNGNNLSKIKERENKDAIGIIICLDKKNNKF